VRCVKAPFFIVSEVRLVSEALAYVSSFFVSNLGCTSVVWFTASYVKATGHESAVVGYSWKMLLM